MKPVIKMFSAGMEMSNSTVHTKITLLQHKSGPGCSKLMISLVNVSLKFQTLIFDKCQYFLLKQDLSQGQDSSPDSALPIT